MNAPTGGWEVTYHTPAGRKGILSENRFWGDGRKTPKGPKQCGHTPSHHASLTLVITPLQI